MINLIDKANNSFFDNVASLIKKARHSVYQSINTKMVYTYFQLGKMIFENEQKGKEKAAYGKHILFRLSEKLSEKFGKGFFERNIEQMRQFYIFFSKSQTVPAEFKLSWSHYIRLMRINNEQEPKQIIDSKYIARKYPDSHIL